MERRGRELGKSGGTPQNFMSKKGLKPFFGSLPPRLNRFPLVSDCSGHAFLTSLFANANPKYLKHSTCVFYHAGCEMKFFSGASPSLPPFNVERKLLEERN